MSASQQIEEHECVFCLGKIARRASLCRHCGAIFDRRPIGHAGRCHYCQSAIDPKAAKCRHCRADLRLAGLGARIETLLATRPQAASFCAEFTVTYDEFVEEPVVGEGGGFKKTAYSVTKRVRVCLLPPTVEVTDAD